MTGAVQADMFTDSAFERFLKFHKANPRVYQLFEMFTLQVIQSGRKQYGAKAIFERVRWESTIISRGDDFKLNNNYTAYYARLYMEAHPEHAGFFETRQRRG